MPASRRGRSARSALVAFCCLLTALAFGSSGVYTAHRERCLQWLPAGRLWSIVDVVDWHLLIVVIGAGPSGSGNTFNAPDAVSFRENIAIASGLGRLGQDLRDPTHSYFSSLTEWHWWRFCFMYHDRPRGSLLYVGLPLWTPIPILMLVPLWRFGYVPLRTHRRRRNGNCRNCDYDLTGNVSGICPECGVRESGVAVAPNGILPESNGSDAEQKGLL